MTYSDKPEVAADYAAGTLLTAPDGTEWFDCFTRGPVVDPIMAEYWAVNSYYTNYSEDGATMLTDDEKSAVSLQSKTFVNTMANWANITGVTLTTTFDAVSGQPLTRTTINLGVDYTKDSVSHHVDVTDLPTDGFDAVQQALVTVKSL
jgi:hypothetical protein